MDNIKAIIGSTEYDLYNGAPFNVLEIEGIGAAIATALSERGPLQHGETDIDFRLDPRVISLSLQAPVTAVWSYQAIRERANKIFTPTNTAIRLQFIYNSGTTYEISTRSLGMPTFPTHIEQKLLVRLGIQLKAADPLFYDPVQQFVSFALAGGGTGFAVPTPIPSLLGASTIDQTTQIIYTGTFKSFPTIDIYGPVTNPVLTNLTTGDKLDFTGISIGNGDYYTIDLRYGRKRVYKNGDETDIRTGELVNSQLATFAIEADPDVAGGANSFQFTGSGISAATQVYVRYYTRYIGV